MYMDKDKIVYYQGDLDQESGTSEKSYPKFSGMQLPRPRGSTLSIQYMDGEDGAFCHLDFSKITDDGMELDRLQSVSRRLY